MSKIAVCLSGQSRFLDECYSSISKNLLIPNNADVFLHTWECDSVSISAPYKFGGNGGWKFHRIPINSHQHAIEIYKPIRYEVEKSRIFRMPNIDMKRTFEKYQRGCFSEAEEAGVSIDDYSRKIINNNMSMWYGIMKSILMAIEHSSDNNFTYDTIIRCRFDVLLNRQLHISHVEENTLYACEMNKPDGHIADWLNFGRQDVMSVYASTFLNYQKIYSDIEKYGLNPICNEAALAHNIARHGILVSNIPMELSLPRL